MILFNAPICSIISSLARFACVRARRARTRTITIRLLTLWSMNTLNIPAYYEPENVEGCTVKGCLLWVPFRPPPGNVGNSRACNATNERTHFRVYVLRKGRNSRNSAECDAMAWFCCNVFSRVLFYVWLGARMRFVLLIENISSECVSDNIILAALFAWTVFYVHSITLSFVI